MDYLNVDSNPNTVGRGKRSRALSTSKATDQQKFQMEKSLDNLQSLLQQVQFDWKQTTEPNANPLDIALPLLDNTSVGLAHRLDEFIELKERISDGLQQAVVVHYQAFNDSIGSYRSVVQNIADSKQNIAKIENTINNSVNDLIESTNNDDLGKSNETLKNYNDMINILNIIEWLQNIPTELESYINEKNYSKAQTILAKVNENADQYNLWELPSLNNLKSYYQLQENQLFETLIEEIHTIIYSKREFALLDNFNKLEDSTYSNVEKVIIDGINIDISEPSKTIHSEYTSFINSLAQLSLSNLNDEVDDQFIKFSSSQPFSQLLKILKIINKIGKLQTSLEIIGQRFTTELNQLINRIVEDIKLKYPKIKEEEDNSKIISDLFTNFFKKSLFLLQSINIIVKINDKISTNPNKILIPSKIWDLLKIEIRSLIKTYIGQDDDLKLTITNTQNQSPVVQQDTKLFQFISVDYKRENTVKLKSALANLFPNFQNSQNLYKIESPYLEDFKFLKNSKLISSDVINMRFILEPFLLFIQGLNSLFETEDGDKFFHEFMQIEFLPLFQNHFEGLYNEEIDLIESLEVIESFEEDESETEYFKFILEFIRFLNDTCFTLNTSLQFRPDYSIIIFRIFEKFHDKLQELYQDLFNELTNLLEPNKELITLLVNPNHQLNTSKIRYDAINKSLLQSNNITPNFQIFTKSLQLLIDKLSKGFIKSIEIPKYDLNLNSIEKLRKVWKFSEFDLLSQSNDLWTNNQWILDDDLRLKFNNEVLINLQKLNENIQNILKNFEIILNNV
ncbi:hypothetical protein WICMUC_004193 [Wickerhamomyces mucosus]|uniref:Exocyst complex component Sec8 n=1 Tax=Wickerhamomyces mucosus TaxID=1378264 RepID=A0A9P8PJB8_9ASCO|nr:hypothetical protein WICMUC_004193 [Wickerhamomyces mucosus]